VSIRLSIKLLAALLIALCAFGQGTTSLNGTVTDPTGAVIPGAKLTLENAATAITRETESDQDGAYRFLQVQPGPYRLKVNKGGFSDLIVNDIQLLVNSPATLNVKFEKVGQVTEVVSVTAEATAVNTVDATLGNNFGTKPILQLPFEGRNVVSLLSLQPGVTFLGDNDSVNDDYRQGSVNGGKSDQANVTLDGVDVNNQQGRQAFTSVLRTTLDSIQEFRVTTTGANADQGRSSGAQIALITKGGTNEFHGSVYHFLRNKATNANNFFNNSAVSDSSPNGIPLTKLNRNIFGAAVGGPIKKNRLFFFGNYEGRKDRREDNVVRTVPTATLRQGNVLYLRTDGSIATLTPADIRTRIDTAGIGVSQAALDLFKLYPLPNDVTVGDGLNLSGYRFNAPTSLDENTFITKIDMVLDQSMKHTMFVRGNLQDDNQTATPQFPGTPANSTYSEQSRGIAVGVNSVFSPSLVNTFRYGLTHQSLDNLGISQTPQVTFRSISSYYGTDRSFIRVTPVNHIAEDVSWIKGAHMIAFGGTARWIRNRRVTDQSSYVSASANRSWLTGSGSGLNRPLADLAPSFIINVRDALTAAMGLITQSDAYYQYSKDGKLLPAGEFIRRQFNSEEYELYVQDTWKLRRNLTVIAGLRYSLMPPIYEANGYQVNSLQSLSGWFDERVGYAQAGKSQDHVTPLSFTLKELQGGRDLYSFNKKNFAPRVSVAWSPEGDGEWVRKIFGAPGKTSVRAGFGMYYDLFGSGLVTNFDRSASGLTTNVTNPSASLTIANAPRYSGFSNVPSSIVIPAPAGGFPQQAPDLFAILNGLDDRIQAPYTMNLNFSVSREFSGSWLAQVAYVGRLSRRSLISEDVAMPTNLVDPSSGIDYFTAAKYLAQNVRDGVDIADVKAHPYWENMFPDLRTGTESATQTAYDVYSWFLPDATYGLYYLDVECYPACSKLGQYAFFNRQYSYLRALRSIANGNYHGGQFTLRKRFSNGDQIDFNYTLSKSIDLASTAERNTSGIIINAFSRRQFRAVSDYDMTHQMNLNWVYSLPFGKNARFGSGVGSLANAIIGGWQFSGLYRHTSGLPTSFYASGIWPTNWNYSSNAVMSVQQTGGVYKNAIAPPGGTSGPNIFSNPGQSLNYFDYALPGESGDRNVVRGGGLFNIDIGLAKRFTTPWEGHSLQIRGEVFNLTNSPSFDPSGVTADISSASSFGKYSNLLTNPRVMQFGLRYEF